MLLSVSVERRSMFTLLLLLNLCNLVLCQLKDRSAEDLSEDEFGTNLVASMRNDANLDLSADEEYEDLRAELLAYHTALASIASSPNRRSMMSTPCWSLGGICVDSKLCTGFRYLTEVPGCKDRLRVCCFAWNKYKVKDWRHKGLGSLAMPWSQQAEFGGRGVIVKNKPKPKTKKDKIKKSNEIVILNDETVDSMETADTKLEYNDQNEKMDNTQLNGLIKDDMEIEQLSQKLENTDDGPVEKEEVVLAEGDEETKYEGDEVNKLILVHEHKNIDNKGIDKQQLLAGEINQEVEKNNEKQEIIGLESMGRNRIGKKHFKRKKALALILNTKK